MGIILKIYIWEELQKMGKMRSHLLPARYTSLERQSMPKAEEIRNKIASEQFELSKHAVDQSINH